MALRKHKNYTPEDVAAALIITGMNSDGKRNRGADDDNQLCSAKRHATDLEFKSTCLKDIGGARTEATNTNNPSSPNLNWVLKPAPYFYYNDRSSEPDDDPWTPLTPPGLIPTFPAKVSHLNLDQFCNFYPYLVHVQHFYHVLSYVP